MLSRVAENLYWMARYVERAEGVARFLDVAFHLELDAAGLLGEGAGPLDGVLAALCCRDEFLRSHAAVDRDAVLHFLTFERQGSHSILAMIARARENARGAQETLNSEAWSQINRLYLHLTSRKAPRRFQASPSRFYDGIKRGCILFDGLVDSTMPRAEVFHFLQLGRYLERVDQTGCLLGVQLPLLRQAEPASDLVLQSVHWTSLLRSCTSHEAYLKAHQNRIDPRGVVRYLILDADSPRTLRFGVARCLESLREIGGGGDTYGSEAERLLGRLESALRYADIDELFDEGLPDFLAQVRQTCHKVGREIHHAYFFT
jgi:uncharacterized alpha-E superfamily protein